MVCRRISTVTEGSVGGKLHVVSTGYGWIAKCESVLQEAGVAFAFASLFREGYCLF